MKYQGAREDRWEDRPDPVYVPLECSSTVSVREVPAQTINYLYRNSTYRTAVKAAIMSG